MIARFACVTLIALTLVACGKPDQAPDQQSVERMIAAAEKFVDAFYAYDPNALGAALVWAEESAPSILFYQGWAEGGNYEVVERMPCKPENADTFSCSITVKDDLMGALGIDFNVTDTFHLTFADEQIVSVATSSNDPQAFYDAEAWVKKNRPELIAEPCRQSADKVPTPGDCVRGMVQGYAEFAASGGLAEDPAASK